MVSSWILLLSLCGLTWAWPGNNRWPPREVVDQELTQQIQGSVIRPWDDTYHYHTMMIYVDHTRRPGAVVLVKNVDDVQKCILFARRYRLQVTILSSGHSFVGRSTADMSLQISFVNMTGVAVDPHEETALVQPGCVMGELYEAVDKYGLISIGGHAQTVAPGGYFVGGGHSPMTRMLGLGVDSVLNFTMVSAQGDIVEANYTTTVINKVDGGREVRNNGDIFWAVRGGGAAYGVVTQYGLKLHRPPPDGFVHLNMFTSIDNPILGVNSAKRFLQFYGPFLANNLTDNWGGYMIINNVPGPVEDEFSNGTIIMTMLHWGGWQQAIQSIQPVLDWWENDEEVGGLPQSIYFLKNYSTFWDYKKNSTDPIYLHSYVWNRLHHYEDFHSLEFASIMTEDIKDGPMITCTGAHIGGHASRVPQDTSSVGEPLRQALMSTTCGTGWGSVQERPFVMTEVQRFRKKFLQHGRGAYYNEPDHYEKDWAEQFWGSNYGRLQQIKAEWDPEGFFSCHMCVATNTTDPCDK